MVAWYATDSIMVDMLTDTMSIIKRAIGRYSTKSRPSIARYIGQVSTDVSTGISVEAPQEKYFKYQNFPTHFSWLMPCE